MPPDPTSWATCARATAGAASCTRGTTGSTRWWGSSLTALDVLQSLKVRQDRRFFDIIESLPGEALPAIFGRVSSVVKWIERETADGGFCDFVK